MTVPITDTLPMAQSFAHFLSVPQPLHLLSSRVWRRWLVMMLTFPLLLGAKSLPTEELATAQAAVTRAESVDADQYAAEALLRARTLLARAQAALTERRAAEAAEWARLAAAEADYAHARSREAATQAELAQRRSEIDELRRRLQMEQTP
ncbi:MAG: DUF4398 domain-containing protein [Lysobacteraceae bacterium]|nr:MAG: DUF4398 domain-containing protein [Xanthomonadaceae bacterium]